MEMGVPWAEYWPFLEAFADFSTAEGFDLFENYLMKCQIALWLEKNLNPKNYESHFTESLIHKSTYETAVHEEKIIENISFGSHTTVDSKPLHGQDSSPVSRQCENDEVEQNNSFSYECQKDVSCGQIVTSPMSSLAECLSGLKLDDSLLDVSVDEAGDLFYLCSDSEEDLSRTSDDLPTNIEELTVPHELKRTASGEPLTGEPNGYSTPPVTKEFPVLNLFIQSCCIPSDLEEFISDYRKVTGDSDDFKFLLILSREEEVKVEGAVRGDIVFIPAMKSVIQYKIFHDVSLELPADTDKSTSIKQDVCYNAYIVLKGATSEMDTVIEALATSTLWIDQALYIEG